MFSRCFWKTVYPLAILGYRLGVLSYKWVNVGCAAWHREWFDPLWHHEWFGDPIACLPDSVNLCGIRYSASEREGLIQFINRDFGTTRITFARDPHDPHDHLWRVELAGNVPAPHCDVAYRWVKAVFGGSFHRTRPCTK